MKRLTINLASDPFVNRVFPMTAVGVVVGLAVALTLFNLVSFILLGRTYRKEKAELSRQEQRLTVLKTDIAQKRKVLESGGITRFAREADFVDSLLKAKRFSWTLFLTDLERIKPYGAMFTSIAPNFTKEGTIDVRLRGVANPRDQLLKLEENLFKDEAFTNSKLQSEKREKSNPWTTFQITFEYLPEVGHER